MMRSCHHCVIVGDDDNTLMASDCVCVFDIGLLVLTSRGLILHMDRSSPKSVCPVLRKHGDNLKIKYCIIGLVIHARFNTVRILPLF
jgi:hypothetical protein